MAKQGDTKKCTFDKCDGTMKFDEKATPVGGNAGFAAPGREPILHPGAPGWVCGANREHIEWVTK